MQIVIDISEKDYESLDRYTSFHDNNDGRILEAVKNGTLPTREECEDAISRQEAIRCCRNEWEEEVEERLRALPSVQPVRKTGKWTGTDEKPYWEFECSECGCELCFDENSTNELEDFVYCPTCGAKMIEAKRIRESGVIATWNDFVE